MLQEKWFSYRELCSYGSNVVLQGKLCIIKWTIATGSFEMDFARAAMSFARTAMSFPRAAMIFAPMTMQRGALDFG